MIRNSAQNPSLVAELCSAERQAFAEAGHGFLEDGLAERVDKQLLLTADAAADDDALRVENVVQAHQPGGNVAGWSIPCSANLFPSAGSRHCTVLE